MRTPTVAIMFLITLALFAPFQPRVAMADQCAQCISSVSPPVYTQLGAYHSFKITWGDSTFGGNLTCIMWMVVHNQLGQTVELSTATFQLAPKANATAYAIVFGLASGNYSATLFSITPSGVAISTTVTEQFTA